MNTLLTAALALAARGRPVFPCNRRKRPIVAEWPKVATTDPARIRRMFSLSGTELIGIPCGEASGVDVLDVDPRNGGDDWMRENVARLPGTRLHRTPSGGFHVLLQHTPGVRNSQSRIGRGVDVRGQGGYFCAPPSPGYSVEVAAPIAPWPSWLLQPGMALSPPEPERPIGSAPPDPITDKRAAAYIDSLLRTLSGAQDGAKHATLIRIGRALGGIAEAAGMTDAASVERLIDALPASVVDWKAARKTAAWALARGKESPIHLFDRPAGRAR